MNGEVLGTRMRTPSAVEVIGSSLVGDVFVMFSVGSGGVLNVPGWRHIGSGFYAPDEVDVFISYKRVEVDAEEVVFSQWGMAADAAMVLTHIRFDTPVPAKWLDTNIQEQPGQHFAMQGFQQQDNSSTVQGYSDGSYSASDSSPGQVPGQFVVTYAAAADATIPAADLSFAPSNAGYSVHLGSSPNVGGDFSVASYSNPTPTEPRVDWVSDDVVDAFLTTSVVFYTVPGSAVNPHWRTSLNGVVLVGDSASPPASGTVVGCLTKPPDGLGVPGLRTEDVTYPQRDGVEHFSDWYDARIITFEEVSIGGTGCDCESPRAAARDLMVAWSRQCDDVELVIWPPECDSDDPELTGPYGAVGRPRVAELTWIGGTTKNIAQATLRFDAVDHRLFLLDANGTPGSGGLCVSAGPTQVSQSVAQAVAGSVLADQHYPLSVNSRDPNNLYGPDSSGIIGYPDVKFSAGSVVVDDGTSATGWAVTSTGFSFAPGAVVPSSGYLAMQGTMGALGGAYTMTATRTGSVTMTNTPILWMDYQVQVFNGGPPAPVVAPALTASFSGGAFGAPILDYVVRNGWRRVGFIAPASFTSVAFRLAGSTPGSTPGYSVAFYIEAVGRAKSRGAISPSTVPADTTSHGLNQIAVGTASTSYNRLITQSGLFSATYTSGMFGWWQCRDVVGTGTVFTFGSSSFSLNIGASSVTFTWNGATQAVSAFAQAALLGSTPTFVMLTWTATNVYLWTSVDNPSNPTNPKLAQTFTASALPSSVFAPALDGSGRYRLSDVISGVNQYGTLATVNTFATAVTRAGLGQGSPLAISDAGNVCSDVVITFTGNNTNPKVQDDVGNFVGVQGVFTTGTTLVLDTSTGTLTVNGVVSNNLITGDPFMGVSPGETLQAFGGGTVQVCWRPAVLSA